MTDFLNPDSKEYKLSTAVAGTLRERTNMALGDILTLIESVLGDTAQTKSTKKLLKQMMWDLGNYNQHTIYYAFGIEPKQLGDSGYLEAVRNGTDGDDMRPAAPAPSIE